MKNIVILFFLLTSQNAIAQSIVGAVYYTQIDSFGTHTKIKMCFDNNKSLYISNQGEKATRTILANGEELDQNDKKKAAQQLLNSGPTNGVYKVYNYAFDKEGDIIYKNWKEDSILVRDINFHEPITIYEYPIPKINWKLISEYKKISIFNCQKAIATFRGRKYIAWFTAQIPVPYGPWKLHGLPGLILEAQDDEKKYQYNFSSIEIPLQDKSLIKNKIISGNRVHYKKYYELLQKSSDERARAKMSKAAARGAAISITPGQVQKQELQYE